jgi:glucosamine kinase
MHRAHGDLLLLGIDGGASGCRARLCTLAGDRVGEGAGGPANIRLDLEQSFASILEAASQCLDEAGMSARDLERTVACLALAGLTEAGWRKVAVQQPHPFRKAVFVPDAQAACVGAHGGRHGGIVVVGTGSIGWAQLNGRQCRVGGWGWPISDEGSGAWLGGEALRQALWAHDGRIPWTELLVALFARFRSDPEAIVRWMTAAGPRDFATLAPEIVAHAAAGDGVAAELMRLAGQHVDALAQRLIACGAERLSLVGGLAASIEPWLAPRTRRRLSAPLGDAVDGALQLAREAAERELNHDENVPRGRVRGAGRTRGAARNA